MNLVLIINDKDDYTRHLAVTLASVLENSNEIWNIKVIYENLPHKNIKKLNEFMKKYSSTIEYIKIDRGQLEKFKVGEGTHLTSIVFARLFIPEILKNEDRAIYLDCDLIVLKPLEKLYNMDLDGKSIGVIPDGKKDQKSSLKRLELDNERIYFNAGVMVMDLEKLRKNKKFEKAMEFCKNPDRELKLNEQDALNIIFENDFKVNDIIWNYTHGNSEENNKNLDEIGIIHYTGDIKPWDARCLSKYRKLYWKYLKKTPWNYYKEENWSIKNIIKRELILFKLTTRKYRYRLKGKQSE